MGCWIITTIGVDPKGGRPLPHIPYFNPSHIKVYPKEDDEDGEGWKTTALTMKDRRKPWEIIRKE